MVAASCSQLSDRCGISDLGKVLGNPSGSLRWALQQKAESCLALSDLLAKSQRQIKERLHFKQRSPRINISVLSFLLQVFRG